MLLATGFGVAGRRAQYGHTARSPQPGMKKENASCSLKKRRRRIKSVSVRHTVKKCRHRKEKPASSRRHIYIFNTEDLDNDDIIAMIEESPYYTRDKTKLLKIRTKAALEDEVAMEEATDNDGVITFC